MIKQFYCTKGNQLIHLDKVEEISDLISDKENLLWIDLNNPSPQEMQLLAEEFKFHPLAIEDAGRQHQRPKVDEYEGYYLVVFYSVRLDPDKYVVQTEEITIFMGKNYLVTVHDQEVPALAEAGRRWQSNSANIEHDVGVLLYSLLDSLVDEYFPLLDKMVDRSDELETNIFDPENPKDQRDYIATMLELKRSLLLLRRIAGPERDVLNILTRRDSPIFSERTRVYFQDIYDNLVRVADTVDSYRDILSSAVDANLSVISNDLNKVMRTLTATSIILMSSTLIVGVYGMNFDNMPELHWQYGYPLAVLAMILIAVVLYIFFKKRKWF